MFPGAKPLFSECLECGVPLFNERYFILKNKLLFIILVIEYYI